MSSYDEILIAQHRDLKRITISSLMKILIFNSNCIGSFGVTILKREP